jgi:hypothetical protein
MGDYLRILIGDTYTYTCNVTVDGSAQNLAGSDVWLTVKEDPGEDADSAAVLQLTSDAGDITINTSVLTCTINSATSANLEPLPLGFWSLRCNTAAGSVYTLDTGRCTITHPATRTRS